MRHHRKVSSVLALAILAIAGCAGAALFGGPAGGDSAAIRTAFSADLAALGGPAVQPGMLALLGTGLLVFGLRNGMRRQRVAADA